MGVGPQGAGPWLGMSPLTGCVSSHFLSAALLLGHLDALGGVGRCLFSVSVGLDPGETVMSRYLHICLGAIEPWFKAGSGRIWEMVLMPCSVFAVLLFKRTP